MINITGHLMISPKVVTDKKIDIKIANVAPEVKNSNKNAKEKKMTRV